MRLNAIKFYLCILLFTISSCTNNSDQSSEVNNCITCYHQVLQYPHELPINIYTEISTVSTKELKNNANITVNEVVLSNENLDEFAKFNPRNGIITYIKFSELIDHWNHISISQDTEEMVNAIPLMRMAVAQCNDTYNQNLIKLQLEYFEQLISESN